ncbi:hypothetical protein DSTSK_07460 [Desulforhabdus sp. TSK]|nr:hypothetical protein DSTSK_07460 [Desulforhabdus sp. TSK]
MTARKCIRCLKIFGCILMKQHRECTECGMCETLCAEDVTGGLCTPCKDEWLQSRRGGTGQAGRKPAVAGGYMQDETAFAPLHPSC